MSTRIFNESPFLKKLLAANSSDGVAAPSPTTTAPTGERVISVAGNYLVVTFFGTGADNTTGTCGVYGWRQVDGLWIPFHLIDLNFTLSTAVGVSGEAVINTERLSDTIEDGTVGGPTLGDQAWRGLSSPAGNVAGHAYIPTLGFPLLELDVYAGTATDVNALHTTM